MSLSRRTLLRTSSALVATSGLSLLGCSNQSGTSVEPTLPGPNFQKALDTAKDLLITAYPETATSTGLDKDDLAGLKSQLTDRTAAGQDAIKSQVRSTLKDLQSIDTSKLSSDDCLLYTSPSPRDLSTSRMPSSA